MVYFRKYVFDAKIISLNPFIFRPPPERALFIFVDQFNIDHCRVKVYSFLLDSRLIFPIQLLLKTLLCQMTVGHMITARH